MSEKDFREKLLIPLLKKMTFNDVYHYHGSTEKGKDIIFWRNDELDVRNNYAIVVKADKITGNASGRNSANEVLFQIQQSFNEPYKDKISGAECIINIVWVVTNKIISKQARESIASICNGRTIRFLELDDIYVMYIKNFKETPIENIIYNTSKLDSMSPNWGIGISKSKDKTIFFPVAKHEFADKVEPLNMSFTIDSKARNKELDVDLNDLLINPNKYNNGIFIPANQIKNFQASPFLQNIIQSSNNIGLHFIPVKTNPKLIKIIIEDLYSNETEIDDIELLVKNEKDLFIVLSNEHQNILIKFELRIYFNNYNIDFSLNIDCNGFNVKFILKYYKFLNALSQTGKISFIDKSNNSIFTQHKLTNNNDNNRYKDFIKLLEALNYIQNTLEIEIIFPEREILISEVENIFHIEKIIKEKIPVFIEANIIEFELERVQINELLEKIKTQNTISICKSNFYYPIFIFDMEINLGKVTWYCDAVELSQTTIDEIQNELNSDYETIKTKFIPVNNAYLIQIYEKFYGEGNKIDDDNILSIIDNIEIKYKK